jgi:general secretion pathway protein K
VLAVAAVRKTERGFALLIVLWTMVLLALLGSTITSAGRSEAKIAAGLVAAADAQAAADGAIAVAAFHLIGGAAQAWNPDGRAYTIHIGGSTVAVTLADQRGKIDPNATPPGIVAALLRNGGLAAATAQNVASAMTDWRSAVDSDLDPTYRSQRRSYGAPHEPFQSIDELSLVAFVTPRIFALLRPNISLYLDQSPYVALAAPPVAAAINVAMQRDHLNLDPEAEAGQLVVSVTATARNRDAQFTRQAMLVVTMAPGKPYNIVEWNQAAR